MIQKSRITIPAVTTDYSHDQMLKDQQQMRQRNRLLQWMKRVNLSLRWMILMLLIGVGVQFVWLSLQQQQRLSDFDIRAQSIADAQLDVASSPVRDVSEYLQPVRRRNIFVNYRDELDARRVNRSEAVAEPVKTLDQFITLSGIIIKSPSLAVVKDLSTHETLFLKTGDGIHGAKVLAIHPDRVQFEFNETLVDLEL